MLENHHCAVGFRLLNANGVLAALPKPELKMLRKWMVEAIINTDMAMHKELLGRMERRVASDGPPLSSASDDDRLLLVTFLMHVADLCTPTLPPAVSKRVAFRLGEEFEAQAHLERAAQQAVTVMLAATDKAKAQMEAGFVTFVVRPLYAMLARAAPDLALFVDRIDSNLAMWKAMAQADSKGASTNNSGRAVRGPRAALALGGRCGEGWCSAERTHHAALLTPLTRLAVFCRCRICWRGTRARRRGARPRSTRRRCRRRSEPPGRSAAAGSERTEERSPTQRRPTRRRRRVHFC